MPCLRSVLLCDNVIDREGSGSDILGQKDIFTAPTLPVKARFTAFAIMTGVPPGTATVELRFCNHNGEELGRYQQKVTIHPDFYGKLRHIYEVLATFETYGTYDLIYELNGEVVGSMQFEIEPAMPDLA